jgi:hypothetical protein
MTHTTTLAKIAKLVACLCAFSAPALWGAYLKFGPEGKFVKVEREDLPVSLVNDKKDATNFTIVDITPKNFVETIWYNVSADVGLKPGAEGRIHTGTKRMYLACDEKGDLTLTPNATEESARWEQTFGSQTASTATMSVFNLYRTCEVTRIN